MHAADSSMMRQETSFDSGWLFHQGNDHDAAVPASDAPGWRPTLVPHDWSVEDRAVPVGSGATAAPTLWDEVDAPDAAGPFDRRLSEGGRNSGWTVGGVGWYRKRFAHPCPSTAGRRVAVRFDGIAVESDVWVNGTHLGAHANAYTPRRYDLTPHLSAEEDNEIVVRARNLGDTSRWYVGSGIYRHTWLTVTDTLHFPDDGVRVTTPLVDAAGSTIQVAAEVANARALPATAVIRCTVLDPSGRPVARGQSAPRAIAPSETAVFTLALDVADTPLWSPQNPALHVLRTEVVEDGFAVDATDTTFGIRSVVMDGAGLRINSEQVTLRGANIHHDHGCLGAVALGRSEERRVARLKDIGFNAIRAAHNPFDPAFYRACDRLGMLVIDEFTDVWDTAKTPEDYATAFDDSWRDDLDALVRRDRNHPSVIMWSIGNEIRSDRTIEIQSTLAARVRELDDTRPLSQGGASGYGFGIGFMSADDPSWSILDVGDTHYLHDLGDITARYPHRAFFSSESFAATMYDDWALVTGNAAMIGDFAWTAWDHLGEAGVGQPWLQPEGAAPPEESLENIGTQSLGSGAYPWYLSGCGDLDILGRRRAQSYYRSVVWGDSALEVAVQRPVPAGREQVAFSWSWFDELRSWTWDVPAGQPMTVRVYTSGDEVTLLLNGAVVKTRAVAPADKRIATFSVPYEPGELAVVASSGGTPIASQSLATAGPPAALRVTAEDDVLTTDPDDLAYLAVEVVDAAGRLVPDAVVRLRVEVDGPGSLAGLANANPRDVDSFRGPYRHTYLGVAQAVVRASGQPGTVRFSAHAEGLESSSIELTVAAPA